MTMTRKSHFDLHLEELFKTHVIKSKNFIGRFHLPIKRDCAETFFIGRHHTAALNQAFISPVNSRKTSKFPFFEIGIKN